MQTANEFEASHKEAFDKLIVEVAEALDVDAEALKASGHLIIRDMDVGLLDYGVNDYGRMTLLFDLGTVPASRKDSIHRQLLETNFRLPRTFGTFVIIPDSGHVGLTYHFDLFDGIDGLAIAKTIYDVVDKYHDMENLFSRKHQAERDEAQRRQLNPGLAAKAKESEVTR